MKAFRRWLGDRWACWTRRCSYYEHYLAYGPAELTHHGYHAAERHCIAAQLRVQRWMDAHPTSYDLPTGMVREAERWERRVRA